MKIDVLVLNGVFDTGLAAVELLYARCPDAQPFCLRVGVGPVRRFGFRITKGTP